MKALDLYISRKVNIWNLFQGGGAFLQCIWSIDILGSSVEAVHRILVLKKNRLETIIFMIF